jgi:hypothetical protein
MKTGCCLWQLRQEEEVAQPYEIAKNAFPHFGSQHVLLSSVLMLILDPETGKISPELDQQLKEMVNNSNFFSISLNF